MSENKKKNQDTKIKIYGPSKALIAEITGMLFDSYHPNLRLSKIKGSDQGGYHAFATIYSEAS